MSLVPMTRCFENSLISQRILEATGSHPMEHLEWRLTSKTFNTELLRWIRRTHFTICVTIVDSLEYVLPEDGWEFQILECNNHKFSNKLADRYFEFLVQVAGVKVTDFRVKYTDKISENELLHDRIMKILLKDQKLKSLVGLEESCQDGCEECKRHILSCDVYGPIQFDMLKRLWNDRKQHFKKLIIDEFLLHRIATHCTDASESREQCLNVLGTMITSNISCDHLQLIIPDDLSGTGIDGFNRLTRPLPREVIEEICRKWNVKSVTLQLKLAVNYDRQKNTAWTRKDSFLTKFRFDDPHQPSQSYTGISLEQVVIDLEKAGMSCMAVFFVDCQPYMWNCDNLISIVRALFPTKQLFIKTYRYGVFDELNCRNTGVINEKNFKKIIKAVSPNHLQQDMEYTCDFQHRIVENREHFDFPQRYMTLQRENAISEPFTELYYNDMRLHDCVHFNMKLAVQTISKIEQKCAENIVMTFRFRNEATNCFLNLNVYVVKSELQKLLTTENVGKDEFLKYYLTAL